MRRNNQTTERGWAMPKVRPAGSTVMMGHDVPAPPSELLKWLEDPSGAPVGVQELLWWQVLEADAVELGRRHPGRQPPLPQAGGGGTRPGTTQEQRRDKERSEDDVVSHLRPRSQAARDRRFARSSIASVLI
jgi:hypothetical protein